MYTNPHNIIVTLVNELEKNEASINRLIQAYQPSRNLIVLEGMRQTLPADAYPSLEIEPTSASNQWATTRSQRPRYQLQFTLTVLNDNEDFGVEYIASLATRLVEILTSPENLQLRVLGETRWDPVHGLSDTYLLDSLIEDVTYNAMKEGSIRTVEFSWFGLIHEPFPDSKWLYGSSDTPTILRPGLVA